MLITNKSAKYRQNNIKDCNNSITRAAQCSVPVLS